MPKARQLTTDRIAPNETTADPVRAQLNRILSSPEFKATPRRRDMLRYLVGEMLAGRADKLKGYSIGVSVFGRADSFDPQSDPIVRLEARRLRRDLDGYFASEGRNDPLLISIPIGHYVPEITVRQAASPESEIAAAEAGDPIGAAAVIPIPLAGTPPSRSVAWTVLACLAVTLAIVAGGAGYWILERPAANALPSSTAQVPAVMVLPFEPLTPDARSSAIGVGLAGSLMADLIRFPDMRLYSPRQSLAGKDPLEEAARLDIPYLIAGDVSTDDEAVHISARLLESATGRVLWSESYQRELKPEQFFVVQDDITSGIAAALGQPYGVIRTELTKRLSKDFEPSMSSYECVLRTFDYRRGFDPERRELVQGCLERAVARDPDYAEAWALLGGIYLDDTRFAEPGAAKQLFDKALSAASHAITLDSNNVTAYKALSAINHYMGNFEQGRNFGLKALELNPNDPDTLAQVGWRTAVRGDFDNGIPLLKKAIARSVKPPGWYFHLIAIDDYLHGRYADMLAAAKNGAVDNLSVSWGLAAIAYNKLGDQKSAEEAVEMMKASPFPMGRDPAAFLRRHQATDEIVDAIVAGLRKAGWTGPGS